MKSPINADNRDELKRILNAILDDDTILDLARMKAAIKKAVASPKDPPEPPRTKMSVWEWLDRTNREVFPGYARLDDIDGVSLQALKALRKIGVRTMGELAQMSYKTVRYGRIGIGRELERELDTVLGDIGLEYDTKLPEDFVPGRFVEFTETGYKLV
jgi:hypothetical protein